MTVGDRLKGLVARVGDKVNVPTMATITEVNDDNVKVAYDGGAEGPPTIWFRSGVLPSYVTNQGH